MNRRDKNILTRKDFYYRVIRYTLFTFMVLTLSLGIGFFGYHYIGNLEWIDSLYNASMIITGMGPVDEMKNDMSKLFASFYAIFSGVVFLSTVAIFFSPFGHRLMHMLAEDQD